MNCDCLGSSMLMIAKFLAERSTSASERVTAADSFLLAFLDDWLSVLLDGESTRSTAPATTSSNGGCCCSAVNLFTFLFLVLCEIGSQLMNYG